MGKISVKTSPQKALKIANLLGILTSLGSILIAVFVHKHKNLSFFSHLKKPCSIAR